LNYLTTVEQFFLSLKGSGLHLSATDYQLIGEWEERRIPVELVCRAIELGCSRIEKKRRNQRENISLTQMQEIVEEEISLEIHKK